MVVATLIGRNKIVNVLRRKTVNSQSALEKLVEAIEQQYNKPDLYRKTPQELVMLGYRLSVPVHLVQSACVEIESEKL